MYKSKNLFPGADDKELERRGGYDENSKKIEIYQNDVRADIMVVTKDTVVEGRTESREVFKIDYDGVCHVNGRTVFLDGELKEALWDMVGIMSGHYRGENNE